MERDKENTNKKLTVTEEQKPKNAIFICDSKTGQEIQIVSSHSSLNKLIQSAFVIKTNFFNSKQIQTPRYIR